MMDQGGRSPRLGGHPPRGTLGYMLAHEQFPVPALVEMGAQAERAGFRLLATSDHFQPWQANQRHSGAAWITLAVLGAASKPAWIGTTVTCPIFRYHPAVVAQAFASLDQLYPGRVFLGVGSGEALNEQAVVGEWPRWRERWDRLIEAITVIRALWTGQPVRHEGENYRVNAMLRDPPPQPIPLLIAANGPRSMRLAGRHGDGLITDPVTWRTHKAAWEEGAREADKDPAELAVLVEHYVVVGGAKETKEAASLWRFGAKAFDGYHDIRDPAVIQQRAETEISDTQATEGWAIGTDPAVHIQAIQDLFDSGVTIVNVHAGQADQARVIGFYGSQVIPTIESRRIRSLQPAQL